MDEKPLEPIIKTYFLSRGCCSEPDPAQNSGPFQCYGCAKLNVFDWLHNIKPAALKERFDVIEVRFKNNRKDFFRVSEDFDVRPGEIVAVEASPGHDIGIISAVGEVVRLQLKKKKINPKSDEIRKVYRKARVSDIEKWVSSIQHEDQAVLKTRKHAGKAGLAMKINDVEYQGDNTKAIFYYTADERVDFRELIKILAEEFKVRIEMKQIGVRQEAGRLGGLGTCGRELCCSTWLTEFQTVTTHSARAQQLSLNPQKLAGQCGKLKCCLNYEYAAYAEAIKNFPNTDILLKTKKGIATHQKTDVFGNIMWYSYLDDPSNLLAIPIDAVRDIIQKNAENIIPEKLEDVSLIRQVKNDFESAKTTQEDIHRFDD